MDARCARVRDDEGGLEGKEYVGRPLKASALAATRRRE
jgi:hypothetical protein